MRRLLILDLFSGTGSSTQAFHDAGHTVVRVELNPEFEATLHMSVLDLTAEMILSRWGRPDFIWASPPCTAFSVSSISHHWDNSSGSPQPRTEAAIHNQELVRHTVALIRDLSPPGGWLIENPRGMLRKLPPVQGLPRRTVTYCQYGDTRMKPTDLWGEVIGWEPKPPCNKGDPCHEAAPRGSRTGTQGIASAKDKARVPYGLGLELLRALEPSVRYPDPMTSDPDLSTSEIYIGACERCGTCATLIPILNPIEEITYCCVPCVRELEAA